MKGLRFFVFKIRGLFLFLPLVAAVLVSCEGAYGEVGGADITDTYRESEDIARYIDGWQGSWYSHFGSRALDGFIVGKWKDIDSLGVRLRVFQGVDFTQPQFLDSRGYLVPALEPDSDNPRGSPRTIDGEDYFIMYDDTVYGQTMGGYSPDQRGYSYIGIVRAVNIFDRDPSTGAVVVEYLAGCYPERVPFQNGLRPLPFFGIFFRILSPSSIQFSNPIKLAARINGEAYHTETSSLSAAVSLNNVENDIEFNNWGEVVPADFEGCKL
jgi:hypothetical protein